jgi:uncharacterized protein (TIGR03435 family)
MSACFRVSHEHVRGRRQLSVAGTAAVVGLVMLGLVSASRVRAQSQTTAGKLSQPFEVASVKPNRSGDPRHFFSFQDPSRLTATNVSTKMIIEFAYNLKDPQLSGGPSWINSDRYDIEAKLEDSVVEEQRKLTLSQREDQDRSMVRLLLADRFKLKVSQTTKLLPVYALVVAQHGPKLAQSISAPTSGAAHTSAPKIGLTGLGRIEMNGVPVSALADVLELVVSRKVIDETRLKGNYDAVLHWTPDERPTMFGTGEPANAPRADSPEISIFTAIQQQLGLKLEARKGPVEIVVIDQVDRASMN